MRLLSLPVAIVAVMAVSACRSATPAPIRQWETSAVPICGPDTEGAIVESSVLHAKPEFAGRVVTVRGDGSRVPVPNVRFHQFSVGKFGAVQDWDPPTSYLFLPEILVDPDGSFRDPYSLAPYVLLWECHDGALVQRKQAETRVFVLRAPGCTDTRVVFDLRWVPHDIEMECAE
jgi:hypothetical protein